MFPAEKSGLPESEIYPQGEVAHGDRNNKENIQGNKNIRLARIKGIEDNRNENRIEGDVLNTYMSSCFFPREGCSLFVFLLKFVLQTR